MIIFHDENLSEHIATALNYLNKGYFNDIEVESTKQRFGRGAKDEEIIPEVGKLGGVLITRDKKIKHAKTRADLCKNYKASVIIISLPKGQGTNWELVKFLIGHWENIVDVCRNVRSPFSYQLTTRGGLKRL